jgi:hypothetical protein
MDNSKRILENATEKWIIGTAVYLCLHLKRLLQAVCDDGFVALGDGVEYLYAHLRHNFLNVLEQPCLKPLREAIPMGVIPESLYNTVDIDDWDFVLSELNAFTAKVMNFCVERGVNPWEDVAVLEACYGYGEAIAAYEAEKKKQVQALWARCEKGAEGSVRLPKRAAERRKWKAIWTVVERQVVAAKPYEEICEWLQKMRPHLTCSPDTLADIVRAGEQGLLSEPS